MRRPTLMKDITSYCFLKVDKVKEEKTVKADEELKRLIRGSKWERFVRPGSIEDMSGGKISWDEKKLLSLGLKFSTGMNERTPLDVATALNRFRYQHDNDPRIPSLSFIRAAVIQLTKGVLLVCFPPPCTTPLVLESLRTPHSSCQS